MRYAARFALLVLLSVSTLSSCATLALRAFNPHEHGTVYAEWPPHRDAGEWWYVTGVLHNGKGGLWLYQFTIFHQAKTLGQGYLLDLALSDYTTGRHIFEEQATTDSRKAYEKKGTLYFEKSSIALKGNRVLLFARGKRLEFNLSMTAEKPPVWQADNGVEAMGTPASRKQMSYYYSFTRLKTAGTVVYDDSTGSRVRVGVAGSSWLDRQWGNFSESGWDWFSIRLFDGTDVMLYAFPSTGFHEGTLNDSSGNVRTFRNFSYETRSWQTRGGSRYGLEWSVSLPNRGTTYKIVALSPNDFNPNRVISYWEGLCKVYDEKGKLVGYAVEETTAAAHPLGDGGS